MTELGGEATRYLAMSNPAKPTISTTDARSAIAGAVVRRNACDFSGPGDRGDGNRLCSGLTVSIGGTASPDPRFGEAFF